MYLPHNLIEFALEPYRHEHKLYNITDGALYGYISMTYSFLLFLGMETVVSR